MSRRASLFATGTALVIGAALRFTGLDLHDAWADEGITWTIHQSVDPIETVNRDANGEPPLYHVLLSWTAPKGSSLGRLRVLSSACGALTLAVWALLLWRTLGPRAAAVGVPLLAISAFHVYYSQELRTYALTAMLGMVVFLLHLELARAGRLGGVAWALLAISEALLVYSHYLSVFFLVALGIGLIAVPRLRTCAGGWTICQLAGAALVAPWVVVMIGCYTGAREARMITDVQWYRDTTAPYAILLLGKSVVPASEGGLRMLAWVALGVSAALALCFLYFGARSVLRGNLGAEGVLALVACVAPVVGLVAFSLLVVPAFNVFHTKYVIWVQAPLLWLGTAWLNDLFERGRGRWALGVIFLQVVLNGWGLLNYRFNPEYLKAPAYRELVERLDREVRPGDWIVYDWLGTAQGLDPALTSRPALRQARRALLVEWKAGPPVVREGRTSLAARRHPPAPCEGPRVWVVLYHDWRTRREEGFTRSLERLTRRVRDSAREGWRVVTEIHVRGLDAYGMER